MHQNVGIEAVKVSGFVRQVGQHPGQAQRFCAHLDDVANLQLQRGEQAGFGPGLARRRAIAYLFGAVERRSAFQLPA